MSSQIIQSIEDFLQAVRADSSSWEPREPKWFRGEPKSDTPLLPTLYRDGLAKFENPLLQMFRSRASSYHDVVPDVEKTDQWLFLARHAGLPMRLLDWTEGALIGLHFALKNVEPVVWMLNPLALNELAGIHSDPSQMREFPLIWLWRPHPTVNPAFENLRGAWELDQPGVQLPVAVYPTYVHAPANAELRTREYLTAEEVEKLIKAARDGRYGHRDAALILIAFRHRLRAVEICDLEWSQVVPALGIALTLIFLWKRRSYNAKRRHSTIGYMSPFCARSRPN